MTELEQKEQLKEIYDRLTIKPTCKDCNYCWKDGRDYTCHHPNEMLNRGMMLVPENHEVSKGMFIACFDDGGGY